MAPVAPRLVLRRLPEAIHEGEVAEEGEAVLEVQVVQSLLQSPRALTPNLSLSLKLIQQGTQTQKRRTQCLNNGGPKFLPDPVFPLLRETVPAQSQAARANLRPHLGGWKKMKSGGATRMTFNSDSSLNYNLLS